MSLRPSIPAVEGVQDKQVAGILGAMKAIIEKATGRTPNSPQIQTLNANATIGGVISKVNEIVNRLQDAATMSTVTSTVEAQDLSVAKAWVKCDSAGGIIASYGVATVVKDGAGLITITWSTPFSSSNYVVVAVTENVASQVLIIRSSPSGPTASAVKLANLDASSVPQDPVCWYVCAFGKQ